MSKSEILRSVITVIFFCIITNIYADSLNVSLVGYAGISDDGYGVFTTDSFAFIADGYEGLRIFDISVPTSPMEVSICSTGYAALEVYIYENNAYVAAGYDGLIIIDVSIPSSPVEIAHIDPIGFGFSIFVKDTLAYLLGYHGLSIINITIPSLPVVVGDFYMAPGIRGDIFVSDSFAYITDNDSGLYVVNVSSPSSPIEIGRFSTGSQAHGVYISGDYAYIANWNNGLRIIDITIPSLPTEVGRYEIDGSAFNVFISGLYAYVAYFYKGLRIVDISRPSFPTEVGHYNPSMSSSRNVYIHGNLAYVVNYYGGPFWILDISYFTGFSCIINHGWNLISVPSSASFSTSTFGTTVFGYDPTISDYYTPDSLVHGKGYWMLSMSSDTIALPGSIPSFSDSINRGWNLIGSIGYPIPKNRISTIPDGLGLCAPYGWNGTDYFFADSLYPGHGYWFLSTGNGRITVGP